MAELSPALREEAGRAVREAIRDQRAGVRAAWPGAVRLGHAAAALAAVPSGPVDRSLALGRPPAPIVERCEAYFSSNLALLQTFVDAAAADGYGDWIDTHVIPLQGPRARPDELADATLRYAAALHAVLTDLRDGRLSPRDLGAASWDQVSGRALRRLALERLEAPDFDARAAADAMNADPLYRANPLRAAGRTQPIAIDRGLSPSSSAFYAAAPDTCAAHLARLEVHEVLAAEAEAVARAPQRMRPQAVAEARLHLALTLARGGTAAPNPSEVMPRLCEATGVSPLERVEPAPRGATETSLRAAVEAGEIDGFVAGPKGLLTFKLKSPEQVAREVLARDQVGMLDHLAPGTRAQIREALGPAEAPGRALTEQLAAHERSTWRRHLASEVINLGLVSVVSGGVGGLAEGAAVGARVSAAEIRAARFFGASATFTSLLGAQRGEVSAADYARDALMFGILGKVGALAPSLAKLAPGRGTLAGLMRLGLAHGANVGATAATLTLATQLEQAVRTGDVQLRAVAKQLEHNLSVVALLHVSNLAIARIRPALRPGAATEREFDRLVERHRVNMTATQAAVDDIARALERGDVDALQRATHALGQAQAEALQTHHDLRAFAHRSIGPEVGAAVDRAAEAVHTELTGRTTEFGPKILQLRALAQRVGPDRVRVLTEALGVEGLAKLADRVPDAVLATIAAEPGRLAGAARALAEVPLDRAGTLREILAEPGLVERLAQAKDPTKWIQGKVQTAAKAPDRDVARDQAIEGMVRRLRESGFMERPDVRRRLQDVPWQDRAEAVRGLIGEEIGRLEAEREYPPSQGYRTLTGVKVYERVEDSMKGQPGVKEFYGRYYKVRAELDVVALKSVEGQPSEVQLVEQVKTGERDSHREAVRQTQRGRETVERHLSGQSDVIVTDAMDVDVSSSINFRSLLHSKARTRGPGRKAFDESLGGLRASDLLAVSRSIEER
jgi:hypothetical protein